MADLTHFDAHGKAVMVDVGAKDESERVAVARASVVMRAETLALIRSGGHAKGESVPVLTLDSLELSACQLIKLDVEGMEAEARAGAKRTIERHRPILYVENDRKDRSEALLGALVERGRGTCEAKVAALESVGARVAGTLREIPELVRGVLAARGVTELDLGDALVGEP